jgi:DNA-directed RNA polymerase specialized sigma24 family protein
VEGTATTQELARAATTGDGAAQRALITRLTPIIRARVMRVMRQGNHCRPPPEYEIQDATQDVWLALLAGQGRALRAWKPEGGMSFDNYVGMIAERRSVSIRRRARFHAEQLDEDTGARTACWNEPESRAGARELLERVVAHVERTVSSEVLQRISEDWFGRTQAELRPDRRSKMYAARHRVRRAAKVLLTQLCAEEDLLLARH